MFLSTMNVLVSGSTAPARTSPYILSSAGAARGLRAEHAAVGLVHEAPSRMLHGAGDRIDLGDGPRRQPLITGLAPTGNLRQGASHISAS